MAATIQKSVKNMQVNSRAKMTDEVNELQQEMAKFSYLVERLDGTLTKLADVTTNVSQLLAVHENKISTQEIISKQLTDLLERRRVETEDKIQLLHKRISSGEKEVEEKIDNQYKNIIKAIDGSRAEGAEQHSKLATRMDKMERWIYIAIGATAIIGFLFNVFGEHHVFHLFG